MSKFMASQEARMAKFESEFNQQQTEMTNKIDNLLKALNNQVLTTPNKDTRNTNSGTQIKDPSSSKHVHFVNVVTIKLINKDREEDDVDRVGIDSESKKEDSKEGKVEEAEIVENYFDKLPTKEERAYHMDLFDDPETPYILGSPIIKAGDPIIPIYNATLGMCMCGKPTSILNLL
jgi:hypothetical protein